jgi:hypothetical protein
MMVLGCEILGVLQLAKGFSVAVVGHTSKSSVWNWFEVSISSERCIVLMDFFVSMS